MARIFISHASADNDATRALQHWLCSQRMVVDQDDVFLDIDARHGIDIGADWRQALDIEVGRCAAMLLLVTSHWLCSKWCEFEYLSALKANKPVLPLLLEPLPTRQLPESLKNRQGARLHVDGSVPAAIETVHCSHEGRPITQHFSKLGLVRLRRGLERAGIRPNSFRIEADSKETTGWRRPYRGLRPLEQADAAVFFGREAELFHALQTMREQLHHARLKLFVILGASGAGKSSFLRAGLLPRLRDDARRWIVLPALRAMHAIEGPDCLAQALSSALEGLGGSKDGIATGSRLHGPDQLFERLHQLRAAARSRYDGTAATPLPVISIDQAEEFFAPGQEQARTLLRWLGEAVARRLCMLVATIRSDHYGVLQDAPELLPLAQHPFNLPPVQLVFWADIIRRPAEALRLCAGAHQEPYFAPQAVVDLQEEFGAPDALPLLAYALQGLFDGHERGGDPAIRSGTSISAGIDRAAALVFEHLGIAESGRATAVRNVFVPRLVQAVDTTQNLQSPIYQRRTAHIDEFADDGARPLIDELVEQRLLTRDHDQVEVAHEAILRRWKLLKELLEQVRRDLLTLQDLERAAADWEENGRSDEYLVHRGTRLAEADALEQLGAAWRGRFERTSMYRMALRKKAGSERRKLWFGIATTSLIALVAVAMAMSADRSNRRQMANRVAATGNAQLSGPNYRNDLQALIRIIGAAGASPSSDTKGMVVTALEQNQHTLWIASTEFKSRTGLCAVAVDAMDRRIAALAGSTAGIWRAADGTLERLLSMPATSAESLPRALAFNRDGSRLLLFDSSNSEIVQWEVASGRILHSCRNGANAHNVVFSPVDDRALAVGDGLWILDGANPCVARRLGSTGPAVFSRDGNSIVASIGNRLHLLDPVTGVVKTTQPGDPASTNLVTRVAVDSRSDRILTVDAQDRIRVWHAHTLEPLQEFVLPAAKVGNQAVAEFYRFGIASIAVDGALHRLGTESGPRLQAVPGHTAGKFVAMAVLHRGDRLVTHGCDGSLRLWDLREQLSLGQRLARSNGRWLSQDGTHIDDFDQLVRQPQVILDEETTADLKLVRIRASGRELSLQAGDAWAIIEVADINPAGTLLVTGDTAGRLRFWDARSGVESGPMIETRSGRITSVAFSLDPQRKGLHVASVARDGLLRFWDAENRRAVGVPLQGPAAGLGQVYFSNDGRRILTEISNNREPHLWPGPLGWFDELCKKVPRTLPEPEWADFLAQQLSVGDENLELPRSRWCRNWEP